MMGHLETYGKRPRAIAHLMIEASGELSLAPAARISEGEDGAAARAHRALEPLDRA